jgi:large conductance mechanosensitive channel
MINTIVSLVLIALVVYFLVVLPYSRFRALFDKTPDPTSMTKDCAFCFSQIPDRATKCPFCTADLGQSPTKAKSGPSPKST